MTAEPIPFDFDLAKRFTDCRSFRFAPGVLLYGGDRITERTAVLHVNNAMHKLDCTSKHQAVLRALRLGLIS